MTGADRSNAGRGRQRGFTLVELMLALLVSSLLVGMILAIFSRMSLAYRGQQQIAGVQQVLAAARAMIDLDARQAGYGMAQGFTTAAKPGNQFPVQVTDSSAGPDQIALFYADPTVQAVVSGIGSWPTSLDLEPTGDPDLVKEFAPGDLIVLSTPRPAVASPLDGTPDASPTGEANIALYTACVVRISPASGSVVIGAPDGIVIDGAPPWGWGGSGDGPCTASPEPGKTMVYKLVAHAYRIDTSTAARAALGPLQQSVTGGLLDGAEVWSDLAYGFTDLQTAVRVRDGGGVDLDGDGDAKYDWYSTDQAAHLDPSLLQISISLVARTDRDVEGIATRATPDLIDPAHPDNNPLGNRASVPLPKLDDPALQGSRIYRYLTFLVDLRNLGVGL